MEILPNNLTLHVSPFKVPQGHWNWRRLINYLAMTSCYCLTLTMGLYCTVSKIKDNICKILPPDVFNGPSEGVSLEVCSGSVARKNQNVKKV